jgi:hypothetical protein
MEEFEPCCPRGTTAGRPSARRSKLRSCFLRLSSMSDFKTVVIQKVGGHYELTQTRVPLLRIPETGFMQYDAQTVFPPEWRSLEDSHPVRLLFWNPETAEYLMAGLEVHPARVAEGHGTSPFRSFLQGFWIPRPPVLLLRPYWNPADPYDPFDGDARRRSFGAQRRFLQILDGLMPPRGWTSILNATDPYLEALGVNSEGMPADPESIRELSLTPPARLDSPAVSKALEVLAVHHTGSCFPVLRDGTLSGAHALCMPALHSCAALFQSLSIPFQEGPFRPH